MKEKENLAFLDFDRCAYQGQKAKQIYRKQKMKDLSNCGWYLSSRSEVDTERDQENRETKRHVLTNRIAEYGRDHHSNFRLHA